MSVVKKVQCGSCGTELGEDTASTEPMPCPNCGSTTRHTHVTVADTTSLHEKMRLKVKKKGVRKPTREVIAGDDFTRSTGQWNLLERVIDRENDSYREKVMDPKSGQVIHEVDEPLSVHRCQGDAKKKRRYYA
jgi:hypothetical protein